MSSYTYLNVTMMIPVACAFVLALVQRRRRNKPLVPFVMGMCGVVAVVVVLTIIFDNIAIASGFFSYNAKAIAHWHIFLMPAEDLFYSVAAAILLPSLWNLFISSEVAIASSSGHDDDGVDSTTDRRS